MSNNYLNTNIKTLREEARLSKEELSKLTGISVERIEALELDASNLKRGEMNALLPHLRISEEDFLSRDIQAERDESKQLMHKKGNREKLDWYYGSKKEKLFYILYLILVPLAAVCSYFLAKANFSQIDPSQFEDGVPFLLQYWQIYFPVFGAAFVSIIFILIDFIKRVLGGFRFWHIFLIIAFYSVLIVVGAILMLPYYIYCIIRLFKKRVK